MNQEKCKKGIHITKGHNSICIDCGVDTSPKEEKQDWNKVLSGMSESIPKEEVIEVLPTKNMYWCKNCKANLTEDLSSIEKRVAQTILKEIKESPKTFGLLDKQGNGGAILVMDIEEIIKSKYE